MEIKVDTLAVSILAVLYQWVLNRRVFEALDWGRRDSGRNLFRLEVPAILDEDAGILNVSPNRS